MAICATCGQENPDGFRFCGGCGSALAGVVGEREQRKVVTVLFCDVAGSTALGERLDAESLRRVLARYFEAMKRVIESHGGTVDKFIGDAVEAVFGVPGLHEDDALRAVRAAAGMREALAELNAELERDYGTTLAARIGVQTGEVVAGTAERLVTGDAVNVAARLEQAARPGEILVGEDTFLLVRDGVVVEPVDPLLLKGKSEPVPAWRLLSVSSEPVMRGPGSAFVGRERELQALQAAWERVRGERRCELVTVVGSAGVGKSRLVTEFLAGVHAEVVHGRCLSYGEGITYWPVVEVVKQLEPRLPGLVLASGVGELIGGLLANEGSASTDEIAWAFRKLLEAAAAERPLVCLFDDIQWGEEAFLDLLEHVAYLSSEAPLLLSCLARPELLERRSGWGGVLRLEPLALAETESLIEARLGGGHALEPELRERILAAAGGNPLFVEEMAAMLQQAGDSVVAVPPTIRALLAARLDQLEAGERRLLERGAVEGEVFHRGAVQALAPEETELTKRLTALVRKELVRPNASQLADEDAFRFRHLLIRDAAYDALPKLTRAELHQRFAGWLETHGQGLVELDELLGYHLEQAHRYKAELGPSDARSRELGAQAGQHLAAAGRRSMGRNDISAAVNLLGRAASVLPADSKTRLELLPGLGVALHDTGELAAAETTLSEALERAVAVGDRRTELHALIERCLLRLDTDPEGGTQELLRVAEQAIDVLTELGDEAGLARAWAGLGLAHHSAFQCGASAQAFEHARAHARRAGDAYQENMHLGWLAAGLVHGPTPIHIGLRRIDELLPLRPRHSTLRRLKAVLVARQGRFDEARTLLAESRRLEEELGLKLARATNAHFRCEVEMLAGDPVAAEREARDSCERLERMGARSYLSTQACQLAQALYALGRDDEADHWAGVGRQLGATDDVLTQALWRQARAKVLARRGQYAEAARLAREAVAVAEQTDALSFHGDALVDLAEVLELAGQAEEAAAAVGQALALYERKGNIVSAARARDRLAQLGTGLPAQPGRGQAPKRCDARRRGDS